VSSAPVEGLSCFEVKPGNDDVTRMQQLAIWHHHHLRISAVGDDVNILNSQI